MEKVLVSSIAEYDQKSIGDTHAIPQKWNYRDTHCDTEKTSKKYRRYQDTSILTALLNFKVKVDPLNIKIIPNYLAALLLKYNGMF